MRYQLKAKVVYILLHSPSLEKISSCSEEREDVKSNFFRKIQDTRLVLLDFHYLFEVEFCLLKENLAMFFAVLRLKFFEFFFFLHETNSLYKMINPAKLPVCVARRLENKIALRCYLALP